MPLPFLQFFEVDHPLGLSRREKQKIQIQDVRVHACLFNPNPKTQITFILGSGNPSGDSLLSRMNSDKYLASVSALKLRVIHTWKNRMNISHTRDACWCTFRTPLPSREVPETLRKRQFEVQTLAGHQVDSASGATFLVKGNTSFLCHWNPYTWGGGGDRFKDKVHNARQSQDKRRK